MFVDSRNRRKLWMDCIQSLVRECGVLQTEMEGKGEKKYGVVQWREREDGEVAA